MSLKGAITGNVRLRTLEDVDIVFPRMSWIMRLQRLICLGLITSRHHCNHYSTLHYSDSYTSTGKSKISKQNLVDQELYHKTTAYLQTGEE